MAQQVVVNATQAPFTFSKKATEAIGAYAVAASAADRKLEAAAIVLHDDGIQARWMQAKVTVNGSTIKNEHFRPECYAAMESILVSKLSERQQKLLSVSNNSLPPKSETGDRSDREHAEKTVERQRKAIIKHMLKLEKADEPADEKALKMLSEKIKDGLAKLKDEVIEFKTASRQDVRKADACDILGNAIEGIDKLHRITK
jgi:hypothetical protein